MDSEQIETFKIVLIGDSSVGKTHIVKRYAANELPKNPAPTIGVEFCTKVVELKDHTKVKAQIWDTAGQERYRAILSQHFRRAIGALLVYDITKENTFNSIAKWMEDLKLLADPNIVIILVGNKLDLVQSNSENRKVTVQQAEEFAKQNNLIFMETSAVVGTKIKDVFEILLQQIYSQKSTLPQEVQGDGGKGGNKLTDPPQRSATTNQCSC